MIDSCFKYRRVLSIILGFVLVSGIFTSCDKGPIDVLYIFGVITENTATADVKDPEIHETYVTLLSELNNELAALMNSTESTILGTGATFKITEGVELEPRDLRSEDEKKIAVANSHILRLKQIDSSYKERIKDLEKQTETSFCIKVNYILIRGSGNSDSVLLQEYQFELGYN